MILVLGLAIAACDRGCSCAPGGSWAWDPAGKSPVPVPSGSVAFPMNAIDCPDGIARCIDGIVEVSRLAAIAQPCIGPPEKCQCPWDRVGGCDHGCVADGIDLALSRAQAFVQLCAPSAADVFARPPLPNVQLPSDLCVAETYHCVSGTVVACAETAMPLATCVNGCAEEGSALDEEGLTRDQVVALLCKH